MAGIRRFSRKMVKLIADFETIVTRTEKEALILENNLVKMHKPHFNIRLKDDKRYPYLKITLNEEFPALLETRTPKSDKATYFGPYAGSGKMRQTVSLAKRVFQVRTGAVINNSRRGGCPWRDTSKLLDKACLEHHIGRCTAPCIAAVSPENYRAQAKALKDFLEGRSTELIKDLQAQMQDAATNMEFERAAKLRDQIEAIRSVTESQQVVSLANEDYDALGFIHRSGRGVGDNFNRARRKTDWRSAFFLDQYRRPRRCRSAVGFRAPALRRANFDSAGNSHATRFGRRRRD